MSAEQHNECCRRWGAIPGGACNLVRIAVLSAKRLTTDSIDQGSEIERIGAAKVVRALERKPHKASAHPSRKHRVQGRRKAFFQIRTLDIQHV